MPLYKKELFLLYLLNSVLHWTSLKDLAFFFWNSVLNCLLMSFIWLSKTPILDIFLGQGGGGRAIASSPSPLPGREGGMSSKSQSLISRDFSSNFFCSIFFLLLEYLQIIFFTFHNLSLFPLCPFNSTHFYLE